MSSDWTARVDQMTAGTIHEQMRTVIGEAREVLEQFQNASWDQGGLVLDAQREFEASFNEKISKVSADVEAAMTSVREQIAGATRSDVPSAALDSLRSDVFVSLAAFGEELDTETKRIREDIAARMTEMTAALDSVKQTHARLEERLEATTAATDERLGAIMTRLDAIASMEDRSTARMVEIFATAFARMRDEQTPPGLAVAG